MMTESHGGEAAFTVSVSEVTAARRAIAIIFGVHAAVWAAWTPHIAEAKHTIGLTDGELGIALAGSPVAHVVSTLLIGGILARRPSATVLRWALIGFCIAAPLPSLSGSFLTLFMAMAVWGGFSGAVNVAMNTESVRIERAHGKPILARLGAFWSFGAFLGAGLGTAGASLHLPTPVEMVAMGMLGLVASVLATSSLVPSMSDADPSGARFARPSAEILGLGIIAFAALLCEGAAEAWSAVYVRDAASIAPSRAGLAYTVYGLCMFGGRLVGDVVVERFGPVTTVRVCTGVAAVGFSLGLLVPDPVAALVAFGLLGLGLSGVVPIVFRASGNLPGTSTGPALAAVSSCGWAGLLVGPPIIGALASATSIRFSLSILVVLILGIFVLARAVAPAASRPASRPEVQ
jgi:predicted MFS family arabinose efflux permease